MPKRRPPKRRSNAAPSRRKTPARAKRGKKKRTKRAQAATRAKRSSAAKKGWAKRRKKQKLIDFLGGWREVALPTKFELHDMMEWAADQFGEQISTMYRWYWGSEGAIEEIEG